MSVFEPFSKFMAMQEESAKHQCIASIVKDYRAGVDVNDDVYLDSIEFFSFPLSTQQEIIKEANAQIKSRF